MLKRRKPTVTLHESPELIRQRAEEEASRRNDGNFAEPADPGSLVDVEGYCWGANPSLGVNFRVTKVLGSAGAAPTAALTYLLPHLGSLRAEGCLPYAQPTVLYRLRLREPIPGQDTYARVLRVRECEPRAHEFTKKELLDYLAFQKGSTADGGYRAAMQRLTRHLPQQFTSPEDLRDKEGLPDWLRQKLELLLEALVARPPTSAFFSLLRYFPGAWLLRFSEPQLRAILSLCCARPEAFCFWDVALRILYSVRDPGSGASLFGPLQRQQLKLPDQWASYRSLVETLTAPEGYPLNFDAAHPVWSVNKLGNCVLDHPSCADRLLELIPEGEGRENLCLAIRFYAWGEQDFYKRGSTALSLKRAMWAMQQRQREMRADPIEPVHAAAAVTLLCELSVMQPPCGDPVDRLTRLDREHDDLQLLAQLGPARCHQDHRVVRCSYYNTHYFGKLRALVMGLGPQRCLVVSANQALAAHAKTVGLGSLEVYSVDTLIAYYYQVHGRGGGGGGEGAPPPPNFHARLTSAEQEPVLLLERAHKMSVRGLHIMLAGLPEEVRVHLVALGDPQEPPVGHFRHGGHLMRDLAPLAVHGVEDWDEDWESLQDPMCAVHQQLAEADVARLSIVTYQPSRAEDWHKCAKDLKDLHEAIKKRNRPLTPAAAAKQAAAAAKGGGGAGGGGRKKLSTQHRSMQVFCSTDYDRRDLLAKLYGMDAKLQAYEFRVGSRVHLPELGVVGELESAWEYTQGTRADSLAGRPLDVRKGIFEVKVGGLTRRVPTEVSLEHAEVMLAGQYAAPPVDLGIFFVSPQSTNRDELMGCLKHCLREARFYVPIDCNFSALLDKRSFFTADTDLGSKLSRGLHRLPQLPLQEED